MSGGSSGAKDYGVSFICRYQSPGSYYVLALLKRPRYNIVRYRDKRPLSLTGGPSRPAPSKTARTRSRPSASAISPPSSRSRRMGRPSVPPRMTTASRAGTSAVRVGSSESFVTLRFDDFVLKYLFDRRLKIKTFGPVDERSLEQLSAAWRRATPSSACSAPTTTRATRSRSAARSRTRATSRPPGAGYDLGCGNKAARTDLTRADLDALGGVERVMSEITRRISFGMGVPAAERADHPVLDRIRDRGVRAAAEARPARRVAARHGRLGQPLRQPDGGRAGPGLGRRPFRLAWLRPQDRLRLPRARRGPAVRRAGAEGEMDSPPVLFEIDSELGRAMSRRWS